MGWVGAQASRSSPRHFLKFRHDASASSLVAPCGRIRLPIRPSVRENRASYASVRRPITTATAVRAARARQARVTRRRRVRAQPPRVTCRSRRATRGATPSRADWLPGRPRRRSRPTATSRRTQSGASSHHAFAIPCRPSRMSAGVGKSKRSQGRVAEQAHSGVRSVACSATPTPKSARASTASGPRPRSPRRKPSAAPTNGASAKTEPVRPAPIRRCAER